MDGQGIIIAICQMVAATQLLDGNVCNPMLPYDAYRAASKAQDRASKYMDFSETDRGRCTLGVRFTTLILGPHEFYAFHL